MSSRPSCACVLAAVLVAGGPLAAQDPDAPFPHRVHVVDQGMACGDCHAGVAESRLASDDLNPGAPVCLDCHDQGSVPAPVPAPGREYRFAHQDHAALGLECQRCHAGVLHEEAGARGLPLMAECMTCHNGVAADRQCGACHTRDRAFLVPASHQPGWRSEHGRQARITDSSCIPCHTVDTCEECHGGALLLDLGGQLGARQTPFAPELEGAAGQTVKRVHGLNYRFLHALEARGKGSNCAVCHDVENGDFCAQCHNPQADPSIRPVWHGGADWGALAGGVGTGGGRHAELARRDMESCVACHEVQGSDPSCLLCHMDRAPGRGNDPRTHSTSFAGDVGEGDFHDDDGAACFACHVRSDRDDPQGLCAYCHPLR
ncbi:MAG: cytochrome c3 family protein [Candidatus Latescibacterota bacterium]